MQHGVMAATRGVTLLIWRKQRGIISYARAHQSIETSGENSMKKKTIATRSAA